MNDDAAERAAMPPPRAAMPKGAAPHVAQNSDELREQLRQSVEEAGPSRPVPMTKAEQLTDGPRLGRPPRSEPLVAIHVIAGVLKPFDRQTKRKILETCLDLTE